MFSSARVGLPWLALILCMSGKPCLHNISRNIDSAGSTWTHSQNLHSCLQCSINQDSQGSETRDEFERPDGDITQISTKVCVFFTGMSEVELHFCYLFMM